MDLVDDIDQECHDLEGQGHITEDEEAEMLSSMEKEYIAQTQRLSEEETMDEEEEEGNSEPKLLTPVTEESETDSLKKDTVEQLPLDIQLEKKTGDIMVDSGLAQSVYSEGGLEVRGRGKERPLSMISVSSVDTGYQPDTDSDAGLLSPVGWSESRSLVSGHHLLPAGGGVGGHVSDAMSSSQMTQADGLMSLSQISQPDVMMMSSLDGLERGDGSLRDSTFTAATSSNVHGDHDLELAQSDIDELKVTGASSELEMKKETSDTESQHDLALEQEELAQMLSTEEAITEDEIVSVPNNETEQEPLQIEQGLALNLDMLEDNESTEAHPASLDVTLQETEEDGETTQDEGVATAPETDTEHAALDMREREKGPDQVEDTDTEQREGTQEKEQLSKKKTSVTKKPSPGKLDGKRKEELAKPKRTSSPRNKKTPEKSELKKPNTKVSSRLADYIHKPVAEKSNDKSKDAVDSKLKKNASNKQKIEGREIAKTQSEDKKSFRRSPTPKKEEPKKIIKKAPVKNKWDNIMSQLEASKEQDKHKPKSEVKSKLAPMIEASPVTTHSPAAKNSPRARSGSNEKRASTPKADYTKVKSRIDTHSSVPIQKRKVSPRLSAGLTKERRESTGSQMSSTRSSRSDLNASVIESKQEKPSNKLTQNLKNEEKSLSRTSINSDTSQGSVTKQGRNHDNGSSSAVPPQKRRSLIVPPSKTSPAESRRGASTTASSGKTAPKTAGKKTETGPQSPATSNKKPLNQNKNRTVRSVVSLKPSSANQPDVVKHSLTRSRANAAQEISRLEALCEQRTKELNLLKLELKASLLGFDAMTVTVRYLTEELDGFSCPRIAAQLKDTQESLAQAQAEIAELKQDKCHLQDEVISLTKQHEEKVDSMKSHHTKTVQNLRHTAEEDKEREVQRIIDQHSHEVTTQRAYHERRVAELTAEYDRKLKEVQDKNQDILEQIKIEQQEQIQELQRNHELRLEEITNKFEDIKSSLLNKVETLRLECEEMRERTKEYEEALQRDSDVKVALALAPYNHLPAEIDSLKTVIEMRNMEIHDLRRHNLEQSKQLEELQIAKEKNIALEQKIENLEAIINIKSDYEKQLSEKHQVLMRRYDRESKANKRLSMDKEELVWRISNSDLSQSVDFGSSGNVRRQISRSPTSSEPGTPDGSRRHARKSPLSTSPAGSDFICSPTHRTSHKRRSGSHMSDDHSRPTSSASEMDEERDDLKFQTM
ncbi:microtubule-associated tumor suppressor candidate 2 isoform X2 [Lingula anatina]|uniref:Microtubule-associated tumor suppressor candidate 2 isoform X2 n=1 Tax=Lingula anatina TaxID=7574 RepID=A0A1S3HQH0_LINAN|nr:microtubule-associated tumor suppressor candidate 2 isoform X2 [Lingula anatina]|eukprot:XP_013387284.1 microtubule-associated tumor suppressor candidate 2 isoform X2 [Lingula anatina]